MFDSYILIDLTQELSTNSPTWDLNCPFGIKTAHGDNFTVQYINLAAGTGTHLDAPAHYIKNAASVEKIKLENLLVSCCVINIKNLAHENFSLETKHISAWEEHFGAVKPNSLVFINTGWAAFWHDKRKYHNNLKFPVLSKQAAEYLLERDIAGLGIDTLSPDRPDSGYPVHEILLSHKKYIIENVANLDLLSETGSWAIALPMKIKNATEAPMRLVALSPKK